MHLNKVKFYFTPLSFSLLLTHTCSTGSLSTSSHLGAVQSPNLDHSFEEVLLEPAGRRSPSPTLDVRKQVKKRKKTDDKITKYLDNLVNDEQLTSQPERIRLSESEKQSIQKIRWEKPKEFKELLERFGKKKVDLLKLKQTTRETLKDHWLMRYRKNYREYIQRLKQPGNENQWQNFKFSERMRNQRYNEKRSKQLKEGTLPPHLVLSREKRLEKQRNQRLKRKQQSKQT